METQAWLRAEEVSVIILLVRLLLLATVVIPIQKEFGFMTSMVVRSILSTFYQSANSRYGATQLGRWSFSTMELLCELVGSSAILFYRS
jgi:hypothetical protein